MSNAIQKSTGGDSIKTLAAFLATRKEQISQVMARGMDIERVTKVALAAVSRSPQLLQCSPQSIYTAIHTGVQLGFEPGGPLGHGYLVPRWNSKTKTVECVFQLGYQGMIELARRSGSVTKLYARAVYEHDTFEVAYGLHEDIKHIPRFDGDRGELRLVYAVAHIRDADPQFVVLGRADIERIKQSSESAKKGFGPWKDHEEAMWLKSAIRNLFKFLPKRVDTPEGRQVAEAIERDDALEVSWETTATPDDDGDSDAPASRTAELRERLSTDSGEIRAPAETPAELRSSEQLSFEARSRVEELKAINSVDALGKWMKRRDAEVTKLPQNEQRVVLDLYQQRLAELS